MIPVSNLRFFLSPWRCQTTLRPIMKTIIYKICPADEWEQAIAAKSYQGSYDDVRDGFIHFSCADQLADTLAKHFAGQTNLVLISLRADNLGEKLKWEASRGGQLFPHLYEALDPSLALKTQAIQLGDNGHILPDLGNA